MYLKKSDEIDNYIWDMPSDIKIEDLSKEIDSAKTITDVY
jgi:hypothetical protein